MEAWKEKIKDLMYDVIDVKPIYFQISTYQKHKDWEIAFNLTEEEKRMGTYEPGYNYIYPLPNDFEVPKKVKDKLKCTTIIKIFTEDVNQKYALVLTGSGQDFGLEIAESYIRLGYYPPIHFCRVSFIADKGSQEDIEIMEICTKALKDVRERLQMDIKNNEYIISQYEEKLKEREKKK